MEKCGICGMELQQSPCVTQDGRCSACDQKLHMEQQEQKK